MRYCKEVENSYILAVGTGNDGVEILEEEYNAIIAVIAQKPPRTGATDYRLKTDLTWEEYEVDPDPDDIDEAEAYNIIFGGEA